MPQKLLRIFTVILTASLTLAVLIGATVYYNKIIYSSPLEASVRKLSAVGSFQVENHNSQTKIRIQFNTKDKLRANFYLLLDQLQGQSKTSSRDLTIIIDNTYDEGLRKFLTEARLPIFEAISTGQFTVLPANLDKLSQQANINYELEIDNNFIFLTANADQDSAHIVINRDNSALIIINTMGSEYL